MLNFGIRNRKIERKRESLNENEKERLRAYVIVCDIEMACACSMRDGAYQIRLQCER